MKILIKITKEVLEKTKNCMSMDITDNCAVAYAARSLFPNAKMGLINLILNPKIDYVIEVPFFVRDFIYLFDTSTPEERVNMKPFSFEIEVPDSVINEIGIGQVYKVLSESKTLEYVAI